MRWRSIIQDTTGTVLTAMVLMMSFSGCGAPAAEAVLQSSNQMKELILAIRNYEDIHDQWPNDLGQVRNDVESDFDMLLQNPITGDHPGYEYVQPPANADPATTVILYQLRDGERDMTLRVGFADGKVAEPVSEQ